MKNFRSVTINDDNTITILNGSTGTYDGKDIKRCVVLNEKEKYKGQGVPFTATIPRGSLPPGLLTNPYIFVGVKVVLDNDEILALYVSENKTQIGTDQYVKDIEEADKIKAEIDKLIQA